MPPVPAQPGPSLRLTLAVFLLWLLVTFLGGLPLVDGQRDISGFLAANIALNLALAAAIALFAGARLGLLRRWFAAPLPGTLAAIWFPMLFLGLLALGAVALGMPTRAAMLHLALNCLFVGLSEEAMFRGLLYRGLRGRMGVMAAALLSSLVFGAIHVLNAAMTGNLTAALAQALFATLLGLVLAAMMLRSGSLIWPVFYHAAWDFFMLILAREAMRQVGPPPDSPALALTLFLPALLALPMALHALWLIRRLKRHDAAMARA